MIDPDALLPAPHAVEHHAREMACSPDAARRAIEEIDLASSWVVRGLMRLRGFRGRSFRVADLKGFEVVAEDPESIALAIRGRFWTPRGGLQPVGELTDVPGTALALWTFMVESAGEGCVVSTETRIRCADEESRRAFRRYWTFVRPFSGLIRLRGLALIERHCTSHS